MRVELNRKFDWRVPGRRAMVSFNPGIHVMKREAGEEAIRVGAGREVKKETDTDADAE